MKLDGSLFFFGEFRGGSFIECYGEAIFGSGEHYGEIASGDYFSLCSA